MSSLFLSLDPRSSEHVLDILPEAGGQFPEKAKVSQHGPSQAGPQQASQGRVQPSPSLSYYGIQQVHSAGTRMTRGYPPCLAPTRLEIGTQTLGGAGDCP